MSVSHTLEAKDSASQEEAWGLQRLFLILLLAAALLVRLPGMGESLWLDEVFMTRIKVGDTLSLMRTLLSDYHPPAYLLFMHCWIGVFGDSELSVRLVPLISGLLSIPVLYELGRRLAGNKAGFFAATLLAFSPTHIWYSHEARPYTTVILMVLVATLAWYRLADPALQGRSLRRWSWAWFLSLGFALFTHYYILALWAAFTFLPWIVRHPRRKRILVLGLSLGISIAISIFIKSRLSSLHTGSSYLRSFTPMEFHDLHFNWFLTGNSFTPRMGPSGFEDLLLLPFSILGLLCLLIGLYRLLFGDLRKPAHLPGFVPVLLWLAIPTLLFILPYLGFPRSYIERSALPALPFFCLFLALGLTALSGRWSRRITTVITACMLLVLMTYSFKNRQSWTVYKPRPEWQQASVWLGKKIGDKPLEEGRVHDLYSLGFMPYALSYYDERFQLGKTFEPNQKAYERMQAALGSIFGSEGWLGVWLKETLASSFAEDRSRLEKLRGILRLRILSLETADPRAPGAGSEAPDFFLLTWPGMVETEPRIQALLQDPGLEILSRQDYRLLSLFHIRRRNH